MVSPSFHLFSLSFLSQLLSSPPFSCHLSPSFLFLALSFPPFHLFSLSFLSQLLSSPPFSSYLSPSFLFFNFFSLSLLLSFLPFSTSLSLSNYLSLIISLPLSLSLPPSPFNCLIFIPFIILSYSIIISSLS